MAVPTLKCMLLHEDTAEALLWALTKIAVVDVPPTIRRLLSRGEVLALRKGGGTGSDRSSSRQWSSGLPTRRST
eukprot:12780115-Prorocentrum_lima.AAC.1